MSDGVDESKGGPKPKKPYTGKPRGFAAMDRSKVSEIASKGGKAAHAAGTAHQFSAEEAKAAGKKGGQALHLSRGRRPTKEEVAAKGSVTAATTGEAPFNQNEGQDPVDADPTGSLTRE